MTVIIDNRMPTASLETLQKLGFEVIPMPKADYLSKPVSAHPDMLFFMGFGKLFCHSRYFEKNAALIERICQSGNLSLVLSDEPTDKKYPRDVLFNCVILGNNLLCNTKSVSGLILDEAINSGMNIIHTNQGYTKCSVCKVSENAVITSDISIARVCTENGIDALTIDEGDILLNGYDLGFIGGASGCDGKNVYFCGDISLHPDGEKIIEFCNSHGKGVISLSNEGLYDVGSILFI
ncbi:MAG: hypothetical protein E7667_04830 [Ruminococcaceae bacterium]|nr:hypothetical protein [Oscillospiraceae bacterium]